MHICMIHVYTKILTKQILSNLCTKIISLINTNHPTTDMLGKQLGVSASSGGALDRLVHVLLKHEAAVVVRMQSDMQLRGIIEADGTSVRHWQSGGCLHYHQWFGMIERNPSGNKRSRKLVLWDIGVATAKRHGKPPPESFAKISQTGACNSITTTHTGYKSLLCSDGAPCYPKVALVVCAAVSTTAKANSTGQMACDLMGASNASTCVQARLMLRGTS